MQAFLLTQEWQNLGPKFSSLGQYPLILICKTHNLQNKPEKQAFFMVMSGHILNRQQAKR
jgi:hypothetical protein